jgi:hypothetical protein
MELVLDGREREWVAKGGTHVIRLSGTLAYLDWAMLGGTELQSVGARYVEAAVRLWREYFWPHSRAALRQIGLTEKHANARRALCWVRAHQRAEVSLLDIRQDALGRRFDAEQTRSLLDGLARAGWLRLVTTRTGGRAIHRWQVNPLLFAGATPLPERPERPESHKGIPLSGLSGLSGKGDGVAMTPGTRDIPTTGLGSEGDDLGEFK